MKKHRVRHVERWTLGTTKQRIYTFTNVRAHIHPNYKHVHTHTMLSQIENNMNDFNLTLSRNKKKIQAVCSREGQGVGKWKTFEKNWTRSNVLVINPRGESKKQHSPIYSVHSLAMKYCFSTLKILIGQNKWKFIITCM